MMLFRRFSGLDRGQVLLAIALLIPVLLGMSAVAVDIGSYADDKRNLQNAADAIALAAAQKLCAANAANCSDTTAAAAAANSYATKNNIDTSHMTITYSGLTPVGGVFTSSPTVHVTITHAHVFAFARVLGVDDKPVSAAAGAARVSPGGLTGLMPWGVTQDTIDSVSSGDLVTIKQGGGGGTTGNYGAMAYDARGSGYGDAILHGARTMICAKDPVTGLPQAGCTPDPGSECSGDQCYTEPGNMVGPTGGVDTRIAHTSSSCDTFNEAFTTPSTYLGGDGGIAAAFAGAGGRLFSPIDGPALKQPTDTPTSTATNHGDTGDDQHANHDPDVGANKHAHAHAHPRWANEHACPHRHQYAGSRDDVRPQPQLQPVERPGRLPASR